MIPQLERWPRTTTVLHSAYGNQHLSQKASSLQLRPRETLSQLTSSILLLLLPLSGADQQPIRSHFPKCGRTSSPITTLPLTTTTKTNPSASNRTTISTPPPPPPPSPPGGSSSSSPVSPSSSPSQASPTPSPPPLAPPRPSRFTGAAERRTLCARISPARPASRQPRGRRWLVLWEFRLGLDLLTGGPRFEAPGSRLILMGLSG